MQIRRAQHSDLKALHTLYQAFFAHNARQQPQYYRNAYEVENFPACILTNEKAALFVAEQAGMVIALLHMAEESTPPVGCFVPHKYAMVVDLYVHHAYRSQGVGGALLQTARQWAKARGLEYLELNVLYENEDAQRFYAREGFQTAAYTMRKMI